MGMYSLKNIYEVLAGTNFYTDHKPYVFFQLDKSVYQPLLKELSKHQDVYAEVINDKDELSVILPKDVWESSFASQFNPQQSMGEVALITCEVQQETQTGYLLSLLTILSTHNIGVYVQGAYTTDHIFVSLDQLEEALRLLNQLKG